MYLLIGADNALPTKEVQAFQFGYNNGRFSALIAEGNTTNADLRRDLRGPGRPARHSRPGLHLPGRAGVHGEPRAGLRPPPRGWIDIAAPLLIEPGSPLHPVAVTPPSSYDVDNSTTGPRTVIGAGTTESGARALVITDSAPFTNSLFNYTQGGVDEKAFVARHGELRRPRQGRTDPPRRLALQAGPRPPSFQMGLPVGPLVVYAIEQSLTSLNGYYASFPSQVSGFLGGFGIHVSLGLATAIVALIILLSVYGAVTRWFAPEKKGKDDQPQPSVERTIVAESQARTDFLQTSRSKAGYVAALSQLYDVLDSIVLGEFGAGISSVDEGALAAKVGADEAARAKKLFLSLSKFHDYATGERRFLFPPVLRWRALTARTTAGGRGLPQPARDVPSRARRSGPQALAGERVRA